MEFSGRARIASELNIAPLIDVVFLLLIFYMLTSSMIKDNQIELDLPSSSSTQPLEQSPVQIQIAQDGSLSLNGARYDKDALQLALRDMLASNPEQALIVRADSRVSAQVLVSAIDLIQQSGATNISLATRTESASQ